MNENDSALKRFYRVYRPIAEKYGLSMVGHFSVYENKKDYIRIYEGEGINKQVIINVEEEDANDCYNRATELLLGWVQFVKKGYKK